MTLELHALKTLSVRAEFALLMDIAMKALVLVRSKDYEK